MSDAELWVRRCGPAAVVGWQRHERAWRVLVVGAAPVRSAEMDRLLADGRTGAGAADVVFDVRADGDARGHLPYGDFDPAAVGAREWWVGRPAEGSAPATGTTWHLSTDGCVPDTPGVEPRQARFVATALGHAVVSVLAPSPAGDRLLASLALADSTDPGGRPVTTGFDERWTWSHQRLREVLAEQVRQAEAAGTTPPPQPSLKDLGELVKAARNEAEAARAAMAHAVARSTQPVVVVQTGVGTVLLGGGVPDEMWCHLARRIEAVGTADVLVAVASPDADRPQRAAASWPPACLLRSTLGLVAAVGLGGSDGSNGGSGGSDPWHAPPGTGRLSAATIRNGDVIEVRLAPCAR